jgi:hypothetical protein
MRNKFLITFSILTIICYCNVKRDNALENSLTHNLGLRLHGVVKAKYEEEYGKGYGVVRVDIIESNISHYDKRGQEPYFCYIHENEAVFYIRSRNVVVGDTIVVNTDSEYAFNSRGNPTFPISGVIWGPFWEYVKELRY